jgi:hypothetical protein
LKSKQKVVGSVMEVFKKSYGCQHMHMVHVLNSFEMQIKHWLEGEVRMSMEKVLFIWDYFSPTFTIANQMKTIDSDVFFFHMHLLKTLQSVKNRKLGLRVPKRVRQKGNRNNISLGLSKIEQKLFCF